MEATKFCSSCGEKINERAIICPKCGVAVQQSTNAKNKLVAGLFGIFLGGFGIHKFYLGKVIQGIIYLLFFWTFIPSLIGFIEGIVYICMSDEKFMLKYGIS